MLVSVVIPLFSLASFNNNTWSLGIKYASFGQIEYDVNDSINGTIIFTKLHDITFTKMRLFDGIEISRENLLDEIPDGTISSVILKHLETPLDIIRYKVPFYLYNNLFLDNNDNVLVSEVHVSVNDMKEWFNLEEFNPNLQHFASTNHYEKRNIKLEGETEYNFLNGLFKLFDLTINNTTLDPLLFGKSQIQGDIPISNLSAFTCFNVEAIKNIDNDGKIKDLVRKLSISLGKDVLISATNELIIKPSYLMVKYNYFPNFNKSKELGVSTYIHVNNVPQEITDDLKIVFPGHYTTSIDEIDKNQSFKELDRFCYFLQAAQLNSIYDLFFLNFKNKETSIINPKFDGSVSSNFPDLSTLHKKLEDNDQLLSFYMPVL